MMAEVKIPYGKAEVCGSPGLYKTLFLILVPLFSKEPAFSGLENPEIGTILEKMSL